MTLDFKRILVPLDFSAGSTRALDYAYAMAMKFDASLHLVHVCEVPSMMTASMDAYAIAYTDWSQRLGEEAERELVGGRRAPLARGETIEERSFASRGWKVKTAVIETGLPNVIRIETSVTGAQTEQVLARAMTLKSERP